MTIEQVNQQLSPEESAGLNAAFGGTDTFNSLPIRAQLGLVVDGHPTSPEERLRLADLLLRHNYVTPEELAKIGIRVITPQRTWKEITTLSDRGLVEDETSTEDLKPRYPLFGVVGPLGAGKTQLVKQLVSTWKNSNFPIVGFRERYPDNPFLKQLYADPSTDGVAFKSEIFFLENKVSQLEKGQKWLGRRSAVLDPAPEMDFIFALAMREMGWMKGPEFDLYAAAYRTLLESKKILKPDYYIVVNAPPDVIKNRIQERGRPFEQKILSEYPEYIDLLSDIVDQFSWSQKDGRPVIRIDSDRFDYVSSPDGAAAVVKEVGNWVRYYSERQVNITGKTQSLLWTPNFIKR